MVIMHTVLWRRGDCTPLNQVPDTEHDKQNIYKHFKKVALASTLSSSAFFISSRRVTPSTNSTNSSILGKKECDPTRVTLLSWDQWLRYCHSNRLRYMYMLIHKYLIHAQPRTRFVLHKVQQFESSDVIEHTSISTLDCSMLHTTHYTYM